MPCASWRSTQFEAGLGILAEDSQDFALNADVCCGRVDGCHLSIGWLEPDHISLSIEALEGGVRAIDQGDDDLSLSCGAGALDEDVVPGDDVFVSHGITTDFKGEDFPVSDDVSEGDAFSGLDGFYRLACSNASEQRQSVGTLLCRSGWKYIDGPATVMSPLEETFVLKIRDVFVDGGERA